MIHLLELMNNVSELDDQLQSTDHLTDDEIKDFCVKYRDAQIKVFDKIKEICEEYKDEK